MVQQKTDSADVYRAAVQHLALFVPWESFLSETSGDINAIWEREKQVLPRRISLIVDNIQLLRRSAEDASRDAKQWGAISGEMDPIGEAVESGFADGDEVLRIAYRSDNIGNAIRLIDVFRNAMGIRQITAGSKEISTMVKKLCRFQATASCSIDDLRGIIIPKSGGRTLSVPERSFSGIEIPRQEQLKHIKSQQKSLSREREKMI